MSLLREALSLLYATKENYLSDDLRFVRDSCLKIDARGTFADMQRVLCGGLSLWTTKDGASEIEDLCKEFTFTQALEIQNTLEDQLRSQDQQIKRLQDEVERLKFRKELNLDVPEPSNSNSTRVASNITSLLSTSIATSPTVAVTIGTLRMSELESAPLSQSSQIHARPKVSVDTSELPSEEEPASQLSSTTIPAAMSTPKVTNTSGLPKIEVASMSQLGSSPSKGLSMMPIEERPTAMSGDEVAQADSATSSPAESSAPTECSTEDQFFDPKEVSSLDVPSFEESGKMTTSKEERDAIGEEDASTCKSDTESLREIMSLD